MDETTELEGDECGEGLARAGGARAEKLNPSLGLLKQAPNLLLGIFKIGRRFSSDS